MARDRSGVVLVLCAPSGTGKTTLTKRLLTEFPRFAFSISCTTRKPRAGEVNGRDYNFITVDEFIRLRGEGFFAEWAEVHGNFYGTPLKATLDLVDAGRDVLFDIDVQGAKQLRSTLRNATFVFILPPSRSELEHRLRSRGTDDDETINRRLANAAIELRDAGLFDAWIVNGDIGTAYDELRAVYLTATLSPSCREGLVDTLLEGWAE